jgi:hypothetical protein
VRTTKHLFAWMLISLCISPSAGSQSTLNSVSKANLCVTEGAIEELPGQRLSVNVAKMRAYVNDWCGRVRSALMRWPSMDRSAFVLITPGCRSILRLVRHLASKHRVAAARNPNEIHYADNILCLPSILFPGCKYGLKG